jgi:alkylhydroperoxidase family enzyme
MTETESALLQYAEFKKALAADKITQKEFFKLTVCTAYCVSETGDPAEVMRLLAQIDTDFFSVDFQEEAAKDSSFAVVASGLADWLVANGHAGEYTEVIAASSGVTN